MLCFYVIAVNSLKLWTVHIFFQILLQSLRPKISSCSMVRGADFTLIHFSYVQEAAQSLCHWVTITLVRSHSASCSLAPAHHSPSPFNSKSMRVFPKPKPKLKSSPIELFGLNRWRRHNFSLCYISHCLLVIHAYTPPCTHAHADTHKLPL